MKHFYAVALLLLVSSLSSYAQWLDNANNFIDSLHMPVSVALSDQTHSIVVKGDNGSYFVLWQDKRNSATNLTDIYGQKYDKDGKRLWTVDGVPVANGTKDEQFNIPQNADYRRYSYAAPDGNGGLYVCWNYTVQVGSYAFYGVAVQHLRADGSQVFGPDGKGIGVPTNDNQINYENPQLVPDAHGGFFIACQAATQYTSDLYAWCYKDEGGSLKLYGGGILNQYGKELVSNTACGVKYDVSSAYAAQVLGYMIYPDQQGGMNAVMAISTNSQQYYLGYNRLCRVKKDCHTSVNRRGRNSDNPGSYDTYETDYKKDSVVRLYNFKTYFYQTTCRPENDPNSIVTYTNTRIENNGYGFLSLNGNITVASDAKYAIELPQGVLLQTGGNINAELIAARERELDGNGGVTPYHLHAYYRANEIYDSLPYQLCTDLDHPYQAYRPTLPDNAPATDTLLAGPDTLIGRPSVYTENYTLAGSGNKVWAAWKGFGMNGNTPGPTNVYLQEVKLAGAGTKKYRFTINTTDKMGLIIGQETSTGFTGTEVFYNTPAIATDDNGHGLFYVEETTRFPRVSPIGDGGVLSWGAMGRPIGNGYYNGHGVGSYNPIAALSNDGTGVVTWESDRWLGTETGYNIWMEHVSNVFTPGYAPPLKTLSSTGTGISESVPAYFTGGTDGWTTISQLVYDPTTNGNSGLTPLVSILDNYPLGFVKVQTYENRFSPLRYANGVPYLDRNFTITVDNNPGGSGSISMRFYITTAEFDALKAADASIATPGDLGVIDQPNTTGTLAQTYTVTGGETALPLTGWGVLPEGYYIEFVAKGFSNFFITKGTVPLPLTWLNVTGRLASSVDAAISWTVTDEKNVKGYTVEYSSSSSGGGYVAGCSVASGNSGVTTSYTCDVALPAPGGYLFRVKQEDLDGRVSYSKTILLSSAAGSAAFVVSPNPASAVAFLQIPAGVVVKKLTLLSVNGRAVWQSAGAFSGVVTIPVASLPAGVYHLQVMQEKEVRVLKIVKR